MKDSEQAAFPSLTQFPLNTNVRYEEGLTKREYFAIKCYQARLMQNNFVRDLSYTDGRMRKETPEEMAKISLKDADELLKQLSS